MSGLRAQPTNWGRWGADDERGTLNLLTPAVVQQAGGCIRSGRVYSLGLPISQSGTPVVGYRNPPQRLTIRNGYDDGARPGAEALGVSEDFLAMPTHAGTHMDALVHCWHGDQIYNGHPASSVNTLRGAARCGIDKTGAIVTRGVLLDLPALQGRNYLEAPHIITAAELEDCARAEGVTLRPGDALLFRTGWGWLLQNERSKFRVPQPGLGMDAAGWIGEQDIAVVGSDNTAIEAMPFENDDYLCVHKALIWKLGVPLLEILDLEALSRDRVYEFLLVVAPLKVEGGMGSPINPIAIA